MSIQVANKTYYKLESETKGDKTEYKLLFPVPQVTRVWIGDKCCFEDTIKKIVMTDWDMLRLTVFRDPEAEPYSLILSGVNYVDFQSIYYNTLDVSVLLASDIGDSYLVANSRIVFAGGESLKNH
ncbi:MAG: hypothetical protein H0Z39_03045 [Peptococcaceae bacterium]|nr:hypothetical protein [Peptococcaceae bacterium]